MNEIKIFENAEFGSVRITSVDGEPWFAGKDVAEALGYTNSRKALADHVDADDKGVTKCDTLGGKQELVIINESGLYSLVLSSKLPGAKKFKRWVTSEVLPSIRKTGVYAAPTVDSAMLYQMAKAMEEKEQRINALTAENEQQRQVIEDYEPKIHYLDTILASHEAMAITQIAADYGLSAVRLNHILHDAGIQHCVNGQWILYRKYMGQGLTKSKTFSFTHSDGRPDTRVTTQWTQKGRVMIHQILTGKGYQANMDKSE